jgi:prepilin-type N-terminal cleavage/methylation domain-containing protein
MKTPRASQSKHGFTLIELLVAMVITTIIVTVLVSITSIAIDTWNRSRSELRAARQAKAMVDTMARDFESLVIRSGNKFEWLVVKTDSPQNSSNAAKMVYFTAATDRYEGEIGSTKDLGGDVSCVGYQLNWSDPLTSGGSGAFQTFVLYRNLVDPKQAFDSLLGQENLEQKFDALPQKIQEDNNFVCENVFQFTVTFHLEVPSTSVGAAPEQRQVIIQPQGGTSEFRINGTGIVTVPARPDLQSAKLKSVGIALTVISDAGIEQLRRSAARAQDAEWMAKNSFQYSKMVHLPGM